MALFIICYIIASAITYLLARPLSVIMFILGAVIIYGWLPKKSDNLKLTRPVLEAMQTRVQTLSVTHTKEGDNYVEMRIVNPSNQSIRHMSFECSKEYGGYRTFEDGTGIKPYSSEIRRYVVLGIDETSTCRLTDIYFGKWTEFTPREWAVAGRLN